MTITFPPEIDLVAIMQSGFWILVSIVSFCLAAYSTWLLIRTAIMWVRASFGGFSDDSPDPYYYYDEIEDEYFFFESKEEYEKAYSYYKESLEEARKAGWNV